MSQSKNVLRLYGSSEADCGYCKGERASIVNKSRDSSSKAYTVVAERLLPSLYEDFLQRGWRRSGVAVYKPDNWQSCCPALTIRLPVDNFIPTRSQKKILRRMNAILCPKQQEKTAKPARAGKHDTRSWSTKDPILDIMYEYLEETGVLEQLKETTAETLREVSPQFADSTAGSSLPSRFFKIQAQSSKTKKGFALGRGSGQFSVITLMSSICASVAGRSKGRIDRDDLSARLVNALRPKLVGARLHPKDVSKTLESSTSSALQKRNEENGSSEVHYKRHRVETTELCVTVHLVERHAASGQIFVHLMVPNQLVSSLNESQNREKSSLALSTVESNEVKIDRLAMWWKSSNQRPPLSVEPPYQLTITTVSAHVSALDPAVHQLYWKYQNKVHGDPDPFQDEGTNTADNLIGEWGTRSPRGWVEKAQTMLNKEYKTFSDGKRHQLTSAFVSFYEFLVENPFSEESLGEQRLGTYHQHYRLANGLLIAVGVVDILPRGLSSVYLYYDPSFSHELVSLGKYAILREIEWTQRAKLPYYYLGYYIESCPKMRYKADYHPSELLCPTTYNWVEADKAKATIQRESPVKHCCTLYQPLPGEETHQVDTDSYLLQMQLDLGQSYPIALSMLTTEGQALVRHPVREFAKEAGRHIALQCTINFS